MEAADAKRPRKLEDEARLFYVAATGATQRLILPLSGSGKFAARLVMAEA